MKDHYQKKFLIELLLQLGFYKTEKGQQLYELSLDELQTEYHRIEEDSNKKSWVNHILTNLSLEELKILMG